MNLTMLKTRMMGLSNGEHRVILAGLDSFSHNTSMWQPNRQTAYGYRALHSIS